MKKPDLRKRDTSSKRNILDKADYSKNNHSKNLETSKLNIFEIMKGDMRAAFTNPIVILLLIGIILLPSMYSLVNIYACWDPYEETGNVKFAIANEDQGAKYNEFTVNAGNDLVSSLSNNTDFKWEFISADELRRGVHNGTYYAGIVIPRDFSESIVSITTDKPHSARLEYIVNEKTNPVGAKLTDAASKAVFNKLNSEIVAFINVAAYDKLGELQTGLAEGADKMENGADQLSAGADKVASGADQLTSGANQVSSGADQLASGASQLSSGATELSVGANKLSGGADQVASGASQVADGTDVLANKSNDIYSTYLRIKNAIENVTDSSKLSDDVDKLDANTAQIAKELRELDNQSYNVSMRAANLSDAAYNLSDDAAQLEMDSKDMASRTHAISGKFDNVSAHISQLNEEIKNNNNKSRIDELLDKIDRELNDTNQNINKLNDGAHQVADGSSQVAGGSQQLASGSQQLASGSKRLADGSYELSNGVHILSNGTIELASGAELLGYSSASALRNASDSIGSAADQLSAVTELSDDEVEDYFLGPVKLQRYEEFPANNYGSQVAPFYLVLSMWVGALINTVMFKTGSSIGTKYEPHEMYLGKLLLFNVMAILQTTVTLIGACILGIDIYNGPVFAFSCYFVAIIFMAIIYSLASLFGEVGKGIAILLLVFQISGSGGVYPVEIMNTIFGILYPFLPMTHGINIVRESQLGLIWANYIPSFIYLLIVGIIVIIAAILLKKRWDKRTKFFEDKLKESGLFN